LCKNCYLIGVYGDKRKRRKVVIIPNFDTTTHKWCNLCESIKTHEDFYADKMKKDGLNANCKACNLIYSWQLMKKINIKPVAQTIIILFNHYYVLRKWFYK
jgi:hypothetical protein